MASKKIQQVMSKLVTATTPSELVDAYLTEIAKAYGVSWLPAGRTESQATKEEVRKFNTSPGCPVPKNIIRHRKTSRKVTKTLKRLALQDLVVSMHPINLVIR